MKILSPLARHKADLAITLGLFLLPLMYFWPVTLGGRTLLPTDNLLAVEPWRSSAFNTGQIPHNQLLNDLVLENYAWKKFILESVRAGEIPLWNPHQFAGLPFLAAGQHSALYPFSILFLILPLPAAYGWFTVIQFWLAGLFAYIFLRVLGVRKLSAVFGALVYEFCLFMVVSVVFTMIIAGAAWLPLVLAAIELIVRRHPVRGQPATIPWLVLGAGALGMQVLAGHIEIVYYTLLIAGAYSAWRLGEHWLSDRRAHRERAEEKGTHPNSAFAAVMRLARPASALLALAVFGLALGAIQFIPLFELASQNFRSGSATFEQIVDWAYPWRHVIAFFIPNFYGNPSHHAYLELFTWQWTLAPLNNHTIDWGVKNFVEGGAYVGLLPLLLVPVVAWQWLKLRFSKEPIDFAFRSLLPASFFFAVPFFLLLAFFSLAFAFPTRLYALLFWLPGINQLHSAFRWVWPFALCAAVLGAYGVEYLWRSHQPPTILGYGLLQRKKRTTSPLTAQLSFLTSPLFLWASPSFLTFLSGLAVWGGALTLAALIIVRVWYERFAGRMDRLVADLALANRAFTDGRMFFSYEAPWMVAFAVLLIASGLVLRLSRSRVYLRGRTLWEPLALGVIVADLFLAGWGFNPASDPRLLNYVPPSVEFLRQDTGLWRFTTFDTRGDKPFNANLGWYFNFQDVRGYDSIFSKQYRQYMEAIQPQGELEYNRIAPITDPAALNSPLLDLLNVKYVISTEPISNPKFSLVYSAEVQIYQNATVIPRAYLAPGTSTLFINDFAEAIKGYDARQYVMVDFRDTDLTPTAAFPAWPVPVEVVQYTANEVTVTANVTETAWLVLNDSYAPGWKAFVREIGSEAETETPITRVNGNFRAVRLEPGAWGVRFKYSPDSFKLGGLISFVAGVTLAFALAVWLWRRAYAGGGDSSTVQRVAKNSIAPMLISLLNRGIDLIFAAFYLRVLGPDDVGKYTLAIVVFGWFDIITNYGLNTFLMRDASRDRTHANRYLMNTTVLRLLLGLVAIPGLALLLGARQLLPNPLTNDTLLAIALLVLAQAPATVSTGLSALFYVYEQAEIPAAVATLTTLLKVTLGTVALVLGWGFVGLAGMSIAVNTLTLSVLVVIVWHLYFAPRWELDWALQKNAVREGFPLMLNHLLATLFFKVDVPLLETIRNQQQAGQGNREVGWYRTAYQYVDAFNVIPSFFTFALFPVMSRQAADPAQRPALTRSYALAVKLLVAVALPVAALTTFLAPTLIGLLGGAQFLPFGAVALAVMVWSIPFGWINSVTNYLLIALNQQRDLTRAFAISLVFNIIANLIFIPLYGFVAAAAITIASEIFEGAWFYFYLRRSLGALPWLNWLWRLWASALVMTGALWLLWSVHPLLALMVGSLLYIALVLGLRAFDAEERALLISIVPERVRGRIKNQS